MIELPRTKKKIIALHTKEASLSLRATKQKAESGAFMWIVQFARFPVNYSLWAANQSFMLSSHVRFKPS